MSPNDVVKIKPTDQGWYVIEAYVDNFNVRLQRENPKVTHRMQIPTPDSDGYITDQFWCLMKYFRWDRCWGSDIHFSDMQIKD